MPPQRARISRKSRASALVRREKSAARVPAARSRIRRVGRGMRTPAHVHDACACAHRMRAKPRQYLLSARRARGRHARMQGLDARGDVHSRAAHADFRRSHACIRMHSC
ncbi:hypothetical protein [Thermomonas flagellata]|uniref:hypothetical protein n=1 Tax=Thermomonas flagellata TaxID=2888524 RepID=UPI001F0474D4|nr:hypothetical protein [Thermomonas flagellata]